MDSILQLALAAALTALVTGLLESLIPKGAGQRVLAMCGGLLLLLVLLRPFAGLMPKGGWESLRLTSEEAGIESMAQVGREITKKIIAERTGAYIVNKSERLGLPITVEVEVSEDVSAPTPWAVTIRSERPEHVKNAISAYIQEELGIPPERQQYLLKEAPR